MLSPSGSRSLSADDPLTLHQLSGVVRCVDRFDRAGDAVRRGLRQDPSLLGDPCPVARRICVGRSIALENLFDVPTFLLLDALSCHETGACRRLRHVDPSHEDTVTLGDRFCMFATRGPSPAVDVRFREVSNDRFTSVSPDRSVFLEGGDRARSAVRIRDEFAPGPPACLGSDLPLLVLDPRKHRQAAIDRRNLCDRPLRGATLACVTGGHHPKPLDI